MRTVDTAITLLTGRGGYPHDDVVAVIDSLIEVGTERHGWLTDDEYSVVLRQLAETEES